MMRTSTLSISGEVVVVLKKYASPLILVSRFAVASEEGDGGVRMETGVFFLCAGPLGHR